MHERGPFVTFTRQLDELAGSWPEHHPAIPTTNTTAAFEALPPLILSTLQARASDQNQPLPDKLTNRNAQHGLRVITRYITYAAIRAHHDGLSLDEFSTIATHEDSFEPLAAIASTQNDLAFRTEMEYGLGRPITEPEPYIIDRYKLDTAITLADLDGRQAGHKIALELQGEDMYDAKCAAHRSDSLRAIYQHMTKICLRDSALVPAALFPQPAGDTSTTNHQSFEIIRL